MVVLSCRFPGDPSDPALITSTRSIAGQGGRILDVDVFTNIHHARSSELDITLTSPNGTVVTLTSDNALVTDDAFAGTWWDDQANPDQAVHANWEIVAGTFTSPPSAGHNNWKVVAAGDYGPTAACRRPRACRPRSRTRTVRRTRSSGAWSVRADRSFQPGAGSRSCPVAGFVRVLR